MPGRVSRLFARIALNLKRFWLTLKSEGCKIGSALSGADRRRLFRGNIIAKSSNSGRGEEIEQYLHPIPSEIFQGKSGKLAIDAALLQLNPYGDGVCCGASLLFSRMYLEGWNIDDLAKEFKAGAPFEAVLLQGYYHWALSSTKVRDNVEALQIAQDIANLHSSEWLMLDATPHKILEAIPKWQSGVYQLYLPVYNSLGLFEGCHSVVLVKENEQSYLFDPNHGTGYNADAKVLVEQLITVYCGKYDQKKSIFRRIVSCIGNVFLMKSSAPVFGEIDNIFGAQRMALTQP